MRKEEWKEQIRKSRYVKGSKLTKKELNDIMQGMMILKPKEEEKENWKPKYKPIKSIGDILNGT